MGAGESEELVAGGEGVRDRGRVLHQDGAARLVGVEHEAAAHRVVLALVQDGAVGVEGLQQHAVGVEVEPAVAVQDHVVVGGEGDLMDPAEADPPLRADVGDHRVGRDRVDEVRLVPGEPEHDGLHAAVAVPRRAEGAEQLDPHGRGAGQLARRGEPRDEPGRGPHRAHGVRARGSDPDLEHVEHGNAHGRSDPRRALVMSTMLD